MIDLIIVLIFLIVICFFLFHEFKRQNHCPECGSKLDWQGQGKVDSPWGSYAIKEVGHCPVCDKDQRVRYRDEQYF